MIDEKFPEAERFFIMGSDNFEKIMTWKNAEELMKKYQYIVLDRKKGDMKDVSSSLVREKLKRGETIENLVPEQILMYIEQMKLYK